MYCAVGVAIVFFREKASGHFNATSEHLSCTAAAEMLMSIQTSSVFLSIGQTTTRKTHLRKMGNWRVITQQGAQ